VAVDSYGRFDIRCANITAALGDLYGENREGRLSSLPDDLKQPASAGRKKKFGDFDAAVATFMYRCL
jgi:hypothetical protein